jgi:glucose-6-phosphate isomerase
MTKCSLREGTNNFRESEGKESKGIFLPERFSQRPASLGQFIQEGERFCSNRSLFEQKSYTAHSFMEIAMA